jgi:indolepyruvate ferredoxin oxidoreductase
VPYFCSGCPHNTSTRVPEGAVALGGIGCHTIAAYTDGRTMMPTHMGGEGLNWTGIAPFSSIPHAFQNLGDGTYFHSGLLAIRGAVAAGANVTYKILYNDAVAMTGGQPVEGGLSPAEIARQLLAERVRRVALVTDDPKRYRRADARPPAGVRVYARDELGAVQKEFAAVTGVTAIIYEQTCAAEKRRRRKRGEHSDPPVRMFINEAVCEGCGDCSVQSNCVSILPSDTEFGTKRQIDQASCNKDYSCAEGFCPSFVSVHGGELRRPEPLAGRLPVVPERPPHGPPPACNVLVAGIGGTGVVTVGAVLAMAAHLEGRHASVVDATGLAQKNGAVSSHVRIGPASATGPTCAPPSARIGVGAADVLLACDLVAGADREAISALDVTRSHVIGNDYVQPTAHFQRDPKVRVAAAPLLAALGAVVPRERVRTVDATNAAALLLGNPIGANFLLVGMAIQCGALPLSASAVEAALRLNGQAVELNVAALTLGRLAVHDAAEFERLLASRPRRSAAAAIDDTLDALVRRRVEALTAYQDRTYAERYERLVRRVEEIERARVHSDELTSAVARSYHRLLAYKDEYEVARLHSDPAFRARLAEVFAGEFEVRFHLAPPLLSRLDKRTGRVRKRRFGPWMHVAFRGLAAARRLRGSWLDPFGWQAERRLERQLIVEYETLVEELLVGLRPETHRLAVTLARWPEAVNGFGHVKARKLAAARESVEASLAAFRSQHCGPTLRPTGGAVTTN